MFIRRMVVVISLFFTASLIIVMRLVYLQLIEGDKLANESPQNRIY